MQQNEIESELEIYQEQTKEGKTKKFWFKDEGKRNYLAYFLNVLNGQIKAIQEEWKKVRCPDEYWIPSILGFPDGGFHP